MKVVIAENRMHAIPVIAKCLHIFIRTLTNIAFYDLKF